MRAAAGKREGERLRAGVVGVGVAVGVLGGDRELVGDAGAGGAGAGVGGFVGVGGGGGAALFPYTTLFRSAGGGGDRLGGDVVELHRAAGAGEAGGEGDRGRGA